jgi:hypothetical protein
MWWSRIGAYTRFLLYSSILIHIAAIFVDVNQWIGNYPNRTIMDLQIYCIFTAPLANVTWLGLAFGLIAFIPEGSAHERECGTLPYFLDFAYLNVQIQLCYTLLGFILFLIIGTTNSPYISMYSVGLYPIYLVYTMSKSLRNPNNPQQLLFFPLEMRSKYVPYFLALFFSILDGGLRIDLFIALLVGFLHLNGLMPQLTVSKEVLQSIENLSCFKWLVSSSNFISVDFIQTPMKSSQRSMISLESKGSDRNLLVSQLQPTGQGVSQVGEPKIIGISSMEGGDLLMGLATPVSEQPISSGVGTTNTKREIENTRDDSLMNHAEIPAKIYSIDVGGSKDPPIAAIKEQYDRLGGDDEQPGRKSHETNPTA